MERVGCKECISPYCHGCNLLMLEQMLKSGKFDSLMDEKRGIKTGIDVRPVVRGKWIDDKGNPVPWDELNKNCPSYSACCSVCGDWLTASDEYPAVGNFCPNCGADMRPEPPKEGE